MAEPRLDVQTAMVADTISVMILEKLAGTSLVAESPDAAAGRACHADDRPDCGNDFNCRRTFNCTRKFKG